MILLGNLLVALALVLHQVINAYNFVLIARAILSFVNPDPRNGIVQFINAVTDPVLDKVRRKVPPLGMFDISIIIVGFGLYFLDVFLVRTLAEYGEQLKL